MLKKKKTTASGEPVMVQSVRRTRSRRMKFCVQRGLGALPSTSKAEGKITAGFFPLRAECINTGIACYRFSNRFKMLQTAILKSSPALGLVLPAVEELIMLNVAVTVTSDISRTHVKYKLLPFFGRSLNTINSRAAGLGQRGLRNRPDSQIHF